jgi:uncharacterized 2Fe-2S/4Fe-4S cluster protein (DUF4445 family)
MLSGAEDVFKAEPLNKGRLAIVVDIGTNQAVNLKVRLKFQGLPAGEAPVRWETLVRVEVIVQA